MKALPTQQERRAVRVLWPGGKIDHWHGSLHPMIFHATMQTHANYEVIANPIVVFGHFRDVVRIETSPHITT